MINSIKGYLKIGFDIVFYLYNLLVVKMFLLEDFQKRNAQIKKENPNPDSFMFKLNGLGQRLSYMILPKKFTLKEQKDLVEVIKMSIKFKNSINQPFYFMSQRQDLRLAVRLRCKEVADELSYKPIHKCLEGKNMLEEEYITLIRVAGRTGDYIPTYESIVESLVDKIKRRNVFIIIMIQPFLTLFTAVAIEIYIAISIVPDLLVNITKEEAPTTLRSYIVIRDILMTQKLEYGIKISIVIVLLFLFSRIPATKLLTNLMLMQFPVINKYIAQWEISKFFNSVNAMIESGASMQESTETAIGLINNKVIRASLQKDLITLGEKTNDLSSILGNAVYIELRIRNQLKIATDSGSNSTDVLKSVVEDYKDSMKKLLDAPASLIIPVMLLCGGAYMFTRLMPLFTEINDFMQNIGS